VIAQATAYAPAPIPASASRSLSSGARLALEVVPLIASCCSSAA
jgi:hypothetical protein